MLRNIMCVLAAVLLLGMAVVAQAEPMITSGTTTVFDCDSFENDTVGNWPSVASTGSWYHDDGIGQTTSNWDPLPQGDQISDAFQVAAAGAAGMPAALANNGSKLLKYSNISGYPPEGTVRRQPNISAILPSDLSSGTAVSAKFNLYVDSINNTSTGFVITAFESLAEPSGTHATRIFNYRCNWLGYIFNRKITDYSSLSAAGGVNDVSIVAYVDGSYVNVATAANGTAMSITPDEWHSIQVDATVRGSYTITVDGVLSGTMNMEARDVRGLCFTSNLSPANGDETLYYVDMVAPVPEPSTLALLATSLFGLLAYAWKKRK